jgi:outer membrane immunogenic protein
LGKCIYLIAALALAITCEAHAEAPTWNGLYVGVNGGYGTSKADVSFLNFSLPGLGSGYDRSFDGALAGGYMGLQHQIGPWVIGVETTFDGMNLSGSAAASATSGGFCDPCTFIDHERFTTDFDSLVTVAGRLGFSHDRLLGYVKGGFASANVHQTGAVSAEFDGCPGCGFTAKAETEDRHNGWTIGGGFEYLIDPRIALGVEYGYIRLADGTDNGVAHVENGGGAGKSDISLRVDPGAVQTVMARLTLLLQTEPWSTP